MRIELRDVSKRFGATLALDRLTLAVPSGGRVALAGPNGSGKSTLLRAIIGLTPCDGAAVDGLDPFTQRAALAPQIAYVPQVSPLISAPVGELVDVVATLRRVEAAEIRRVARSLGLPIGLVDRRPVRALSGGMKQKLLIALALAAPVSLIAFDEPTASLDRCARGVFFALCAERLAEATMLLSSHRPDEIGRLATRVVSLADGRIDSDEPVGDWLARSAAWAAPFRSTHVSPEVVS